MPKFLLIALNGPTEGNDDAYNKWYDEVHAADLISVTGARSVNRYRIVRQNRIDKPYANVTEIEGESADAIMAELAEKASTFPDTIDRSNSIFILAEQMSGD